MAPSHKNHNCSGKRRNAKLLQLSRLFINGLQADFLKIKFIKELQQYEKSLITLDPTMLGKQQLLFHYIINISILGLFKHLLDIFYHLNQDTFSSTKVTPRN